MLYLVARVIVHGSYKSSRLYSNYNYEILSFVAKKSFLSWNGGESLLFAKQTAVVYSFMIWTTQTLRWDVTGRQNLFVCGRPVTPTEVRTHIKSDTC